MRTINITLFRANYIWFEKYDPSQSPCLEDYDEEADQVINLSINYDYENLAKDLWRIYIDIGLEIIPIGSIMVRSAFEFKKNGIVWDDIFVFDMIHPLVKIAIEKSIQGFIEQSDLVDINIPIEIPIDEELLKKFTVNMINQYHQFRRFADISNEFLIKHRGLKCCSTVESVIIFKCTFIVLDEILYNNANFNREHNRDVVGDRIPMHHYLTIKMNCMEIENKFVALNFHDTIIFFQCLDCALQMLLSNKADLLMPKLNNAGMTKEIRSTFFNAGSKLFCQLNTMLTNCHARIINLETKTDWERLIR